MNSILFDFNTCKTLYLWCWRLDLWWYVVLEQADGLHGVKSWFKYILRVFFISCKFEWVLLKVWWIVFYLISILLKLYTCDVRNWTYGGMLCWSKRMACMMFKGGLNTYWECFSFLASLKKHCWLDVMNNILFDLNTYTTLYLWCWKLDLWWYVVLEQADNLYGVKR